MARHPSGRFLNDPVARERREIFRAALQDNGLTPAKLAARIGLSTPNAFYNLLNGHTRDMSRDLVTRILPQLPRSDPDVLLGVKPRPLVQPEVTTPAFCGPPPSSDSAESVQLLASFARLHGELSMLPHAMERCLQSLTIMEVRLNDFFKRNCSSPGASVPR